MRGPRRKRARRASRDPSPARRPLSRKGRGERSPACAKPSAGACGSARASTYGEDMRGALAQARGAGEKARRAAHCDQRRADACARAARARRRRRLHPREDDARGRRAPDPGQRRAPSEIARAKWRGCSPRRRRRSRRRSASSTASPSASTSWRTAIRKSCARAFATPQAALEAFALEGARARYPEGVPERDARGAEARARPHRLARLRALFPHRARHRALRPLARNSVPGPRLGGQFGGLLLSRDHRGRSGALRSPVRALRLARAQRAAGHRRRFRARAARGGDPVHLSALRARAGRARRRGDHLPHALGDPRDGESLRPLRRRDHGAERDRLGPRLDADRRGGARAPPGSIPPIRRSRWR